MLPNFMVIGVAKCGTTSLCNALEKHPEIYFSQPKEPNYFNKSIHYETTRDEYEKLFENAGSLPLRGEGSVGYTNPNRIHFVPKRIHELIPDCKLIFMVRHPIKRLESEWKMSLRLGNTSQGFNEALQFNMKLYIHGLYWNTLSHYLKYFRKDQILTIFMEDLHKSFDTEFMRALVHLGADTQFKITLAHSNSAESYRKHSGFSSFLKVILSDQIKARIPNSLKTVYKRYFTTEFDYAIEWDPDIYAEVAQYFAEDSQALLEYCGKPGNFWDFSFPAENKSRAMSLNAT